MILFGSLLPIFLDRDFSTAFYIAAIIWVCISIPAMIGLWEHPVAGVLALIVMIVAVFVHAGAHDCALIRSILYGYCVGTLSVPILLLLSSLFHRS